MIQLQCEAIPTEEFTKMADIHSYIPGSGMEGGLLV